MTAVEPEYARQVAERIGQSRRGEKRTSRYLETQLWALLETTPEAREAFGQPHDARLQEHVDQLDPSAFWSGYQRLLSLYEDSVR